MTSIFRENEYFDHERNFCIAYGIMARRFVERAFLANRISYFIKIRRRSVITKILSGWRAEDMFVIRINDRDIERAIPLVKDNEKVEIIASVPGTDWSPKEKLKRLERERAEAEKERREKEAQAEAEKERREKEAQAEAEENSGEKENTGDTDGGEIGETG